VTPFTPQQNGLSKREVVYNAINGRETDTLIRYEEMPFGRDALIGMRTGVAKLMEREQNRTLICVPGEGWKIVTGLDHVNQATRTRKAATRRMGRAAHLAESVDRRDLSGEGQRKADAELISTRTAYGVLRGLASKASKITVEQIQEWQRENGG
jgi:hypothetical protein